MKKVEGQSWADGQWLELMRWLRDKSVFDGMLLMTGMILVACLLIQVPYSSYFF